MKALLPFNLFISNDIEGWRRSTFWEKEPETIHWIQCFDNREVFIDVGANIGIYSLYAASIYGGMRIYSIEPQLENFQALSFNIYLNEFKNIQAHQVGLTGYNGPGTFYTQENMAGASGGQMSEHPGEYNGKGYDVPALTFDSFCKQNKIHPSHIKIDIDGGELQVIEGMRDVLRDPCLKSILIEVPIEDKEIIHFTISQFGFRFSNINNIRPHSSERREREGIKVENIIFERGG